mmetsp:Transcript_17617/g.43954  ORF Transcript_17617/g.43954 Transcript_17617/m.43954 type:complete len:381 (+) Transcript_17617:2379-3521(+)
MVRVVPVELRDSRGLAPDNFVVDPYRQQKDAIKGSKRQHRQRVQKGVDRNPKSKAEEGFDPTGNLDKFFHLFVRVVIGFLHAIKIVQPFRFDITLFLFVLGVTAVADFAHAVVVVDRGIVLAAHADSGCVVACNAAGAISHVDDWKAVGTVSPLDFGNRFRVGMCGLRRRSQRRRRQRLFFDAAAAAHFQTFLWFAGLFRREDPCDNRITAQNRRRPGASWKRIQGRNMTGTLKAVVRLVVCGTAQNRRRPGASWKRIQGRNMTGTLKAVVRLVVCGTAPPIVLVAAVSARSIPKIEFAVVRVQNVIAQVFAQTPAGKFFRLLSRTPVLIRKRKAAQNVVSIRLAAFVIPAIASIPPRRCRHDGRWGFQYGNVRGRDSRK